MAKASPFNWETIEREYITTNETYKSLAATHGVKFDRVKYHGTQGNWVAKRRAWRHKCLRRGLERDAGKKADSISAFQTAQIAAIEVLVVELSEVIQELADAREDASLTLVRRIALIHHVAGAQAAIVKTSHLLTGEATEITRSLDTYRELLDDCGIKPNEMSGAQGDDTGGDSTTGATETLDGEGSP